MWSAMFGYYEATKILLKHKADPNLADNDDKTALMIAVDFGHSEIAKCLLNNGAKPKQRNKNNKENKMTTEIKPGDKVALCSGGPLMTVSEITDGIATCFWATKGKTKGSIKIKNTVICVSGIRTLPEKAFPFVEIVPFSIYPKQCEMSELYEENNEENKNDN